MLAPLRERDFALLWAGQTVSLIGNGVFTVALAWAALDLGDARSLSLVLVARFVPATLLLLAGGLASDRLPRRTTMLACDAVQAVALGVLAALAATDRMRLWHLVAVAVVAGAASGFFLPASSALLPEVLPRDRLVAGNALNTASRLTTARLAGPALGGVLVATAGAGAAFAVDAATFAVSALTLAALRAGRTPLDRPPGIGLLADLREGLAFCLSRRWLAVSLAAFSVLNLAASGPLSVLVPLYVTDRLHLGAPALGLLLAVEGVGGGVAALLAGHLRPPRRPVVTTHAAFAVAGVALAGPAVLDTLVAVALLLGVAGLLLELGNVWWASAVQEHVPNDLLGRVSSVDWLVSGGLIPVGTALAGAAAAATSAAVVFAAGGAVTAAVSAAAAVALRRADPGAAAD
ncbi:MAG TPA: MFS transporter [Mycobacteriales bacterium]|jgi:MFS family permease|nr:MFS transporter [Mycobacteriales bacterium]